MNVEAFKNAVVLNVHHIDAYRKVALHKHEKSDEVFYCVQGSGYGVLEDREIELKTGETFIVPAGTMHALRTDTDLYVCSFLVPLAREYT